MKKGLLSKVFIVFTLLLTFISTIIIPSGSKASASTTEITQSYVIINSIAREDNTIKFTIPDDIMIKGVTYERVYYLEDEKVSDLINEDNLRKGFGTNEYEFDIEENTIGIKIWKIKHQVTPEYYKNKLTKGPNTVGELGSVNKKNYITVTSDKLESYSFSCKEVMDLPWYLWNPYAFAIQGGDYLFNQENCASYVWYFNLDKEIDRIESLSVEYATFTYKEVAWGLLESKYNYQTHSATINAEQEVYYYKKFSQVAREECSNISVCNNKLFEKGKEQFIHKAFGISDEEGYEWYLQVSLNDLLKENNLLWGAYERQDYLQEVSLIKISYWQNGEYFEDVNVLDEDTGELIVKADDSPIDKLVQFIDKAEKWINNNLHILLYIGLGMVFILCLPIIMKILTIINNILSSTSDQLEKLTEKKKEGAS